MLDLHADQSPRQLVKDYARLYAPTRTPSEPCGSNNRLRAAKAADFGDLILDFSSSLQVRNSTLRA
jgi:hypothetical protein